MKKLRVFMLGLLTAILLTGCGQTRNFASAGYGDEIYYGASVQTTDDIMRTYTHYYTLAQIDSMCIIDKLPRNLDEWVTEKYLDFEYSKYIIKRMYIKVYSEESELIYTIIPREELYKVTKRYVNCDPYEETKNNKTIKKNPPKIKKYGPIFKDNKVKMN